MDQYQTSRAPSPRLSVVIVIVSDTTSARPDAVQLAGCLDMLRKQINPPTMEIVVPLQPGVVGWDQLMERFPDVTFVPINDLKRFTGRPGSREHHDELRARGLAAARGEIIALLEDHARPDLHWCARIAEAHAAKHAAIGGAIENGIDRPLNWAVYFCDFGKYQNPLPDGPSSFVSDANVSYKRSALEAIRPVWQESFQETVVNSTLLARGETLVLSSNIIVYQHRAALTLGSALKERFVWGRSYAATRSRLVSRTRRLVYAVLAPILPIILLGRMAVQVLQRRQHVDRFISALPLTALLTLCWSLGEFLGYLTARVGATYGPSVSHTTDQ